MTRSPPLRLATWMALSLIGALGVPSEAAPPSLGYEAVSPGLEYVRLEGDGVVSHVLRLDLKAEGLRARSVKAKGKETVRDMVARVEGEGSTVLAAINGDFFRQDTVAGLPYGAQVADGRLIFAPMKRSIIGFGPKNEPSIDIVKLRARLTFAPPGNRQGATWTPVDDVNVLEAEISGRDGVYLFTPAFLGLKLGRAKGTIAVLDAIRPALQVGDVCEGVVSRVEASDQEVDVPDGGCLLFFNGTTARAMAAKVKPGHPVALKIDLPPIDGDVTQAIGGGPRVVRDGHTSVELKQEDFDSIYAAEISKRHPRSAVGFDRARKTLFLVMVEGRTEQSRGMTFRELGDLMVRVGCHHAMAFDGGGSSALYVTGKGLVGKSMNAKGKAEEREVANALLVTRPPKQASTDGPAPGSSPMEPNPADPAGPAMGEPPPPKDPPPK